MRLQFRHSQLAEALGLTPAARGRRTAYSYALAIAIGASAAALGQLALSLGDYPRVTAQYGGHGGRPAEASCPPGERVIGARVFTSDKQVAGIAPLCGAALAPSGQAGTYRGGLGTQQGASVALRCPAGWIAVGLWGASGALVDRISLSCAPRPGGPVVHLRGVGGDGGAGFHASCPRGALRGLTGRVGELLDSIGMLCDDAAN
jgi:hypothetical protein